MVGMVNRTSTGTSEAERHSEGAIAKTIENQTAKLPSEVWLMLAMGAIGASLWMQMKEKKHESLFIGQWVAPFLLLGIYNKLVKIGSSDRT